MTLDTAVDESRKKMADSVTLFNMRREAYGRLQYDFLAFLPCFLLFLFSLFIPVFFSSSCFFRCPAAICSSPASIRRLLVSVVSCLISEILLSFVLVQVLVY